MYSMYVQMLMYTLVDRIVEVGLKRISYKVLEGGTYQ